MRKNWKSVFYIIILFVILFLVGCQDEVQEVTAPVIENMNSEKNINYISSGVIKSDSIIAIMFDESQVSVDDVGKRYTTEGVFNFTPEIKGEYYWQNQRTVVFQPEEPLIERDKYIGTIDLGELFPGIEDISPEKKIFEFETLGQFVKSFDGDFMIKEDTDITNVDNTEIGGNKLYFRADFVLAEKASIDDVKEAVRLIEGDNIYQLDIKSDNNQKFTVKSEVISRTDQHRDFIFSINEDKLQMAEGFTKEFSLSPAGMLELNRIEEVRSGDHSDIKVVFSDQLDPEMDYHPYVNIKPYSDIIIDVDGRNMFINGDFATGQKYQLTFLSGLRSRLGKEFSTSRDYQVDITISDILPKLEFMNDGVFLTSAKEKKISFRTMNVERVLLRVKKIEEDNIISFADSNSLRVRHDNYYDYDEFRFKRTGEILTSRVLDIGTERNRWIQSEIDLSELIEDDNGLYIVQLEYRPEDALYFPGDWRDYRIRDYVWENGKKYKHLIMSNLGISMKKTSSNYHVFVTDVLTARPVENARVILKDDNSNIIESDYTDSDGYCVLDQNNNAEYIEVRKLYQYSLLKLDEARLDYSLFDIGGTDSLSGIKAFIYTDRGVYRPGETINLSLIARNRDETFPDKQPVSMKLYNPEHKLVLEKTSNEADDGFYTFEFSTDTDALTGNWEARFNVAGKAFYKTIKIETVVPYKIEVNIEPEKEELTLLDEEINFNLSSKYLFGSPAAGLDSSSQIRIEPYNMSFNKYSNFFFGNESMELESIESHFIKQSLDEDGQTEVSWERPEIDSVPSALGAVIECKVIQEGGRQVPASEFVPINVYDRYVGIKKIRGYAAEMGSKVKFDVILVSGDGEYVPDQQLTYRIYKQRRYWWWHYGSRARFMKHYKSDEDTVLVREGEITSREGVASIEHLLDDYGEMLIEVEDPASGHTAAYFFRSRWWGSSDSDASPDIVTIKTDKELYYPGDEAEVHLNTPEKGSVLLTVEKSGEIIYQKWQDIEGHDTEIVVPITEEFLPNAYIYAAVFQPYEQTVNDLPIRMYGVLPITVEKPDARLNFEIEAPESIEPNTDFEVKINANKQAQFTIAVVDEGLLDITDFQTPDPLKYFFARERLDIRTYDNYSQIVGLDSGYIYNTFSVGGGIQKEDYREKQQQSDETERFKPVALFSGPVKTDENGEAVVSFSMPNYIGRVRVMVVGAAEGSYGNAEADIAVKSPLMILPTLPRVLGPEDRIKVPVTVFGLEDDLGEVKVSIETEGPVDVTGYNEKTLNFSEISTKNIEFELSALRAIGASKIIIRAESSGVVSPQGDSSANGENSYSAEKIVDLAVRSYNPYTYLQEDKAVMADSTEVFTVPEEGLRNSSNAQLTVSSRKSLNINTRLKWLIRYPYGCIEQTTSSAFPQLYLDELLGLSTERRHEIDDNINLTIDRLRKFQLDNGGFSYWPYGDSVNYWGTNYAGHFLLEAKRKGYYVPEDMYNGWIKYQKERSQQNSSRMLTRAYRLYLLALAGEENLNAMNYMRESKLDEMNNIAEFYLAAAYKYAGYDDVGTELMEGLDLKVDDYNEFSGSYGSSIRDKAIILEVLTLFEDYQRGLALYNNLADDLSSDSWLSTQTTAYSLMAGSKYLASFDTTDNQARGYILLPDNEQIDFKLEENIQTIPLNCYSDDIKVVNTSELPVFASLEWEGIPLHDTVETEDNNLFLTVNWYDEDGNKIDPSTLPQGTTFWGRFTIDKEYRKDVDEVALVQILPSGWEIENVRLLESSLPHWMDDYRLNHEEYLDIRDDRIMWFFDLDRYSYEYDFVVKLNAVTVGDFYLPPTVVEAMYNNRFKATKAGRGISVTGR